MLVLNQEQLAHKVLGNWFKHDRFDTLIWQLNMYRFHKIPHLQQGVLKSDFSTDYEHFTHEYFHCSQPELISCIQRKKKSYANKRWSCHRHTYACNSSALHDSWSGFWKSSDSWWYWDHPMSAIKYYCQSWWVKAVSSAAMERCHGCQEEAERTREHH